MKTRKHEIINLFLFIIVTFSDAVSVQRKYHQTVTGELVFTSILYRHGIRNPNTLDSKDPYRDMSYWPEGLGMLINAGKLQQFELGQWLRRRYESLIPGGKYSHDLIYVQSSNWDRTLMSAAANLAGLFYPTEEEIWGQLEWQPVPVHSIPERMDKLIAVKHPCPKINREYKSVKHSPPVKRFNKEHKKIYEYISQHTGIEINNPIKASHVYVTKLIEEIRNYTLPSWTNTVFPDELYHIASYAFQMKTMTKTLKKLKGGPLLKDMITHMKQKRSGTLNPDRNLWVYSGHDVTVAALLDVMGVFDPHPPPFAATVMVELRKNNDDYFVSVHYKNTTEEPQLLTIPGCAESCPLDKFEHLLKGMIPEDWDRECQLSFQSEEDDQSLDDDYWLKDASMNSGEKIDDNNYD